MSITRLRSSDSSLASASPSGVYLTGGTLTAASTFAVDYCFTANSAMYELFIYGASSATLNLLLRLRAAGTDITAANYAYNNGGATTNGATSAVIQDFNNTGGPERNAVRLTFIEPNSGVYPRWFGNGFSTNGFASATRNGGQYRGTTNADGFSVTTSTGTITGAWSLFRIREG